MTKKLKKLSQEDLDGIEYAVKSVALETNMTKEEVEEGIEVLKKLRTGELCEKEYFQAIYDKYPSHPKYKGNKKELKTKFA